MENKNWGGTREGAGRKSKEQEQQLIEKLSPYEDQAHEALSKALQSGKSWAVKLYFEYMYGKPKGMQEIDINTGGVNIPLISWANMFEESDENGHGDESGNGEGINKPLISWGE